MLNVKKTSIRQSLAEISFHTAMFVFLPLQKTGGPPLENFIMSHMYVLMQFENGCSTSRQNENAGGWNPTRVKCQGKLQYISLNKFYPELSRK